MLPSFANQSIVRVRPGTTTSRGSTVPDWSSDKVKKLTISGCSIQPASTSLSQDGRILGIYDGWTAYIPDGSDVKAGDHIEFVICLLLSSVVYQQEADAAIIGKAFQLTHHLVIVGVAVLIPTSLPDFLEGVNDNQLGVRVFPDELL